MEQVMTQTMVQAVGQTHEVRTQVIPDSALGSQSMDIENAGLFEVILFRILFGFHPKKLSFFMKGF